MRAALTGMSGGAGPSPSRGGHEKGAVGGQGDNYGGGRALELLQPQGGATASLR